MTKKSTSAKKEKHSSVALNSIVQAPVAVAKKTTPSSSTANQETEIVLPVTKVNTEKQLKKDKPKKVKMIRDSFTLPESDYVKLAELKKKCLEAGVHVKKSELMRAGLLSLSKLNNPALLKTIEQVEIIKTGRPAKE
jgi:hypothetical protein